MDGNTMRSVQYARNLNNPIQATQLRSVGLAMRVRGCVPEARHYSTRPLYRAFCTPSEHRSRYHHTLRSTSLRLYGVIRISCLWHDMTKLHP